MKKQLVVSALIGAMLGLSGGVMAQSSSEEGNWLVRARVLSLMTSQLNTAALPTVPTDSLKVSDKVLPEIDISYFFTKNIAAELVLALPQKHEVKVSGSSLGHFTQLPPTLTAQYHFNVTPQVKPYVGAGMTYLRAWNNELADGMKVRQDNFGVAMQAGVDFKLDKNWSINLDVKKIYMNVDVNSSAGQRVTTIHLDPLLVSAGVGYRF